MNIRDAAEKTGLSAHTIRFYEKSGVLPKIRRSETGIRQFTESDVRFLKFVSALRKTGMPLEDITEFIQDGCILERMEEEKISAQPVSKRRDILQKHKEHLLKQRNEIEQLIDAVDQKLSFYEDYLTRQSKKERNEDG